MLKHLSARKKGRYLNGRNLPTAHWCVASASGLLEGANAAQTARAEFRRLQPGYTIASFRAEKLSDDATFLAQRERYYRGLRVAGLPD